MDLENKTKSELEEIIDEAKEKLFEITKEERIKHLKKEIKILEGRGVDNEHCSNCDSFFEKGTHSFDDCRYLNR